MSSEITMPPLIVCAKVIQEEKKRTRENAIMEGRSIDLHIGSREEITNCQQRKQSNKQEECENNDYNNDD